MVVIWPLFLAVTVFCSFYAGFLLTTPKCLAPKNRKAHAGCPFAAIVPALTFTIQLLFMRTVKDILQAKAKPFNEVSPSTMVIDALKMLSTINLSYLVVMDDDVYKGIFSERDYSRNVILKGRHSDSTTVAEVMTTDLPVAELDTTVEHCIQLIDQHRTRYLLAFDETEKFAGVITIHDLLRLVLSDKEAVFDTDLAQRLVDEDEGKVY